MRNRKYRAWGLISFLYGFGIVAILLGILVFNGFGQVFMLIVGPIAIVIATLIAPMYFELQEDRIVVFQAVFSTSRMHRSSFKKRIFMFDEITDIYLYENNTEIVICFNDGNRVWFAVERLFIKKQIEELINGIKNQIDEKQSI